eukprot:6007873-Lingulodinium_polyedra.AAC.1
MNGRPPRGAGPPDAMIGGVSRGRVGASPPNAAGVQLVARPTGRARAEFQDGARGLGHAVLGALA